MCVASFCSRNLLNSPFFLKRRRGGKAAPFPLTDNFEASAHYASARSTLGRRWKLTSSVLVSRIA